MYKINFAEQFYIKNWDEFLKRVDEWKKQHNSKTVPLEDLEFKFEFGLRPAT